MNTLSRIGAGDGKGRGVDGLVTPEDAAQVIEIVGEACAMEGPAEIARRHVMNRLCELIDADFWTWGIAADLRPGCLPAWILQLHGGFTDEQFAKFMQAQEHPDLARLTEPFGRLVQQSGRHVTRLRQQTDPEDFFSRSGAFELWAEADVAPGIMSCRRVDATTLASVTIHRRMSRPLFAERESRLAHIVLSEIPWLYPRGLPASDVGRVPRLSPRKRTVLLLLVIGQTRREIAAHLGLSEHTVNDYVKDVFSTFGVRSQAQLVSKFVAGDGGDVDSHALVAQPDTPGFGG